MITKTYNVFTFEELTEEQKDKAINNYRDINTEDVDADVWVIEEWEEKLQRQGFEDAKINYSGFWSQGDGASFDCSVNLEQFIKGRRCITEYKKQLDAFNDGDISIAITNNGHYCHEYTMQIDIIEDYNELITDKLEQFILEEARDQARKTYKALEDNYNYQSSDESITETLKVNEYYFTEDGKID